MKGSTMLDHIILFVFGPLAALLWAATLVLIANS